MKIINLGNRIMNTYLYKAPCGYVMIDTGYEHSLESVQKKLAKWGLQLDDIRYVFLTHAHDDHAGFLKELLEKTTNLRVIASGKALPTLNAGQNSFTGGCSNFLAFVFCNMMALFGKGEHRFPAIGELLAHRFVFVTDENRSALEVDLGGVILFTPGHTSDSISLKVGDVVFCGDAAMNGLPSLNRITIWVENKVEFAYSWDTLLQSQAATVYPAHGKPFGVTDLKKYKNRIRVRKLYPLR